MIFLISGKARKTRAVPENSGDGKNVAIKIFWYELYANPLVN